MLNHFQKGYQNRHVISLRLMIYILVALRNLEGVVWVNFENAL